VSRTEKQVQVQAALPVTLIPIRIDMDIQPFRPEAPLPTPSNARDFGINEGLPAYKQPDVTPAYRLKDTFLWNLHEALMTPDQFAKQFVDELDLPTDRKPQIIYNIAGQIRQQLEEYAGVALHPLFHSTSAPTVQGTTAKPTLLPATRDGTSRLKLTVQTHLPLLLYRLASRHQQQPCLRKSSTIRTTPTVV
jgi:chromatin structure-remodeling complex subunit SFH1